MNLDTASSVPELFNHHVSNPFDDDVVLVLKVHLLIEEALFSYLVHKVKNPEHLEVARLSFLQMVHLAKAFSDRLPPDRWQWSAIVQLNAIRNQFAHRLDTDNAKSKLEVLVRFISTNREIPAFDLTQFIGDGHPELKTINAWINTHPRFALFDIYSSLVHALGVAP